MFGLPEDFLQSHLIEHWIGTYRWVWPVSEVFHFIGLILLVGTVAILDLRILGIGKRIPYSNLAPLMPWAVLGFILCVVTGLVFVTGLWANVQMLPMEALAIDRFLQLKFIFIGLAGINLLLFTYTPVARRIDVLAANEEAPASAKVMGAASLVLWVGIVYWGRLIPWGL